ncbi:Gfo/Idh/MocA family oxidoreductase [Candidatus Micrarchaeota archaeon]|nr:Gfo/Idh/MocA family oxidoreductase [Candidatus Micrarchaeota archaeon]
MKVMVVGAGVMGRHHARNYSSFKDVDEVMVVEPGEESRTKLAEMKLEGITFCSTIEEALEKKPDAASVAVPTKLHYEVATKLIGKGIPCLIEKPIAASMEEGKKIKALAEAKKTIVMAGHIERFNPGVLALKDKVNELGEIVYASAQRFGIPGPRDLGNAFYDQGVHDMDIISFVTGKKPKSAQAVQQSFNQTNDLGSAIVEYEGFYAGVEVNRVVPVKRRKLLLLGTKGMAELDYISQELTLTLTDKPVHGAKNFDEILWRVGRGTEVKPYFAKDEPLKLELEHFLECAGQKKKPLCTIDDGLAAIAVAEACVKSAKTGKTEQVEA